MNLSNDYKKQLTELHKIKAFGNAKKISPEIKNIIINYNIKSVLDFGSGKGFFSESLKEAFPHLQVYSYDPVTSPIDLPTQVDLIYSSDVLEHVEPSFLNKTIEYFYSVSKFQYHLIACHPAKKTLSDGRNAHLIVENHNWWKEKFQNFITDEWSIITSESRVKVGKTKKLGMIEQEKYIIFLKNNLSN
jgi:hypothetical protein